MHFTNACKYVSSFAPSSCHGKKETWALILTNAA
jgi:hypothetical protein